MGYLRMNDVKIYDIVSQHKYTPSPTAWEDQVFYFLLVDRFSDGNESGYCDNAGNLVKGNGTPMFTTVQANNLKRTVWEMNSQGWKGGNIKGLTSKLGYLKRMGITAIWVSPIFKQRESADTYHGYGIQNFLEIDPHFGTIQDLVDMVKKAHDLGLYVILDIILNHTGDVFKYNPDRYEKWDDHGNKYMDPRWDGNPYEVEGFYNAQGQASIQFKPEATETPNNAVFPVELQNPTTFSCKGRINNWDYEPEFLDGDFCDFKNIQLGYGPLDKYRPSNALQLLSVVYKYWIAIADVDGYRIDTVKHMDLGATRYFASVIHEFAQRLGKDNFFLMGEITGGRERAIHTLETTGLDAALGIDDIPDKMEYLVKGYRNPSEYFDLFRNSLLVGKDSHIWFRDKVVTLFDDHDQVRKGKFKARFCAKDNGLDLLLNVLALNALTLGIPCVYYGSEQSFNGSYVVEKDGNDVFLRESMFGGNYGSFQSAGYHFFNEKSNAYAEFSKILKIRDDEIALRRGRQYLRAISGDGTHFGLPEMIGNVIRSVVPWSRIHDTQEVLVAINTDSQNAKVVWTSIQDELHPLGSTMECIYSSNNTQIGQVIPVQFKNGKVVQITVPAAGCVIYK